MAGSPLRRLAKQQGVEPIYYFPQEIADARKKVADNLPMLVDSMLRKAAGLYKEREDKDGNKVVYQVDPDLRACVYLMDRIMGSPRTEANPVADRLDTARASYIELQIGHDIVASQKKELEARGDRARIEVEMWPKQFVTEEEEMSNLQALARATNEPLLSMTPEKFEEMIKDKDPSEALETLKGYLGRAQADIIAEVMKYKGGGEEVEEDEE